MSKSQSIACLAGVALLSVGCAAEEPAFSGAVATASIQDAATDATPFGGELTAAAVAYAGSVAAAERGAAVEFRAMGEASASGGGRRVELQQIHAGLPVIDSRVYVIEKDDRLIGLTGVLTTGLGGFDVVPAIDAADAIDASRAELAHAAPAAVVFEDAADLAILPRGAERAALVWDVTLSATHPDGEDVRWRYRVDADTAAILGAEPIALGNCSFWERVRCAANPFVECLCADVCGDGACSANEDAYTCGRDCGCAAASDLCGGGPAPAGCWCDGEDESCIDVGICDLPPAPEGGIGAQCEYGEWEPNFVEQVRLRAIKSAYYAVANGSVLAGADDARAYLLHFLGNSGLEVGVDVEGMLYFEVPSFYEAVSDRIDEIIAAAVESVRTSGATGTVVVPVEAVWDTAATTMDESLNWYFALGSWDWAITGTVEVTPTNGQFEILFSADTHVSKKYDWDPNKQVGPGGIFNQADLAALHCAGWAQEFWIKGFHSETFSWTVP